MRAPEPGVVEVLWQTIEPLLPPTVETHPLGCLRRRVSDRVCFRGILIRLVTGSSWVDIEAILDRGYDSGAVRQQLAAAGIDDANICAAPRCKAWPSSPSGSGCGGSSKP